MAAKTPSTIVRHSAGSQTKIVATFTDIDSGDTWASGLGSNVQDYILQRTDAPTSLTAATVSESSGTFTFATSEDDIAVKLIVFGTF